MTSFRFTAVASAVLAAAVLLPQPVTAQTPPASAPSTAGQSSPPQGGAPATPPFTAGWNDGFALQTANGDFRLLFGVIVQTDGRFAVDDPLPITNTFILRKVRPTLSGRVGRYFDFKVMPDLGSGASTVQDAYFDIRFSPKFRIRTGKDKSPVGYELLVGDAFLLFPERSLASSLVPNRDIGVQVQGDLAGGKLFYAGGIINGVPDGSSTTTEVDTNSDKDVAGRIVVQPFRSATQPDRALNGLGFQLGGSTGQQTGALPSFRTSVGQTYFSYATTSTANGVRNRVTPALFYYYKAFGAFGEYMRSTQPVEKAGTRTDVTNTAWDVTASFVLTGETGADRGVRPRAPFDPAAGTWGALQLVARYAQLSIDEDVFVVDLASATASQKANSFTIGANWYPASFIKYYATFERTKFSGGSASRPAENVILFRAQLAF